MHLAATLVLLAWLVVGLGLTLGPGHPLPGQVVTDNLVPFHTLLNVLGALLGYTVLRLATPGRRAA
jgi:hypothetical protein